MLFWYCNFCNKYAWSSNKLPFPVNISVKAKEFKCNIRSSYRPVIATFLCQVQRNFVQHSKEYAGFIIWSWQISTFRSSIILRTKKTDGPVKRRQFDATAAAVCERNKTASSGKVVNLPVRDFTRQMQGGHTSLKVLEKSINFSRTWKILETRIGP